MLEMKATGRADLSAYMPKDFRSTRMDDAHIERVIAQMWKDWHYVLDPHTACAFTEMSQEKTSVVLATASPAKFPDVVTRATGTEPTHPVLEALKSLPLQTYPQPASTEAVKEFIRSRVNTIAK